MQTNRTMTCILASLVVLAMADARPIGPGPDAIYYANQALIQLEAQNPPGLSPDKYHAAAVKIDEAIAILQSRQ